MSEPRVRATLALNMIARNEAPRIGAAIESAAKVCDELIVVDTGSTDRTVDFAVEHGATVYHHEWRDDYSAARNEALDYTTSDWILVLDADDVLYDDAVAAILVLKAELSDCHDGVMMEYLYEWNGEVCTKQFPIQRLVRRDPALRWVEPAHEHIVFPDPSRTLLRRDIAVHHRPGTKDRSDRSGQLRALRGAIDRGTATARTWFNYASELRNSGSLRDAIAAFRHYLAEGHESLPGGRYHALVSAATCHLALGEMAAGREAAARAILLDASRAEAYSVIGESEFMRRRYAAAIPLFKAAVNSTQPLEGHVAAETYTWLSHERLAACYNRIGRIDESVAHATKAIEGHPSPGQMLAFIRLSQSSTPPTT